MVPKLSYFITLLINGNKIYWILSVLILIIQRSQIWGYITPPFYALFWHLIQMFFFIETYAINPYIIKDFMMFPNT